MSNLVFPGFESQFRSNLNEIVGHLDSSSQLTDNLIKKVAFLIFKSTKSQGDLSFASITKFEIDIIKTSVKRLNLPFDISWCICAKSLYYAQTQELWGKEVSSKDLYGQIIITKRK